MYSVYLLRFPDNRVYVGSTSQPLRSRWNNGNGYRFNQEMWEEIKTHGWENIEKVVVADGLSKTEASAIEQKTIALYRSSTTAFGFNRELGGICGDKIIPLSVKEKMRRSCVGEKNHNYGTHFSSEHRKKLAKANLNKKRSAETCKRIGEAKKKPVSQYSLSGEYLATFDCGKSAAIATNTQAGHIAKVCKRQRASAGGFVWRYA